MKKKIWIHKARSFQEAEKFDAEYYLRMTPAERIRTMQFLRETWHKMNRDSDDSREGLRRIITIVQ